jgi:hypothetical protein
MDKQEYSVKHALFRQEVNHIIKSPDRSLFTNIMLDYNHSILNKEEKEEYIFGTALSLSEFYEAVEDFLQYLIFEYKINEQYYIKTAHPNGNKPVEDMFAKRNLVEELKQELGNSSDTPTKRLKV